MKNQHKIIQYKDKEYIVAITEKNEPINHSYTFLH